MCKYDFCICCAAADARWAEMLGNSLKKYKLPRNVKLSDPELDHRRIALDTAEKPLDDDTEKLLEGSRRLVVICTPNARGSEPIKERLDLFARAHSKADIIPVIAEGTPQEAFPDFFIEQKKTRHIPPDMSVEERVETVEPVASDLRGDTPRRVRELLRYETVRITASALNMLPDTLEQRHARRRRKRMIAIASAASCVLLAVAVAFTFFGAKAKRAGDTAALQTEESVSVAQRLLKELPEMFADDSEALERVNETIDRAMEILAGSDLDTLAGISRENGGAE